MTVEAFPVAKKIKVADARAQLQITQEQLAQQAHVARQVVQNAEKGLQISRLSAHAILKALNTARANEGLSPLDLDDLDWKIAGGTS